MELGTFCTHNFKIIFSTFFFQGLINKLGFSQNIAFIQISHFSCNYRVKYLKCLRTIKYILEHKCEWNLSLVWLLLAIVAFYLNCLDRLVLAHPFWALAIFPVCFSVLSCWKNRALSMGTKWSSWILKKTYRMLKAIYVPNDDYFVSVGLQRTNRKIGKSVTLYQRELFNKMPHLGTFCT